MMTDQQFEAWMAVDPEAALAAQAAQYDTPRRTAQVDREMFHACRGEVVPSGLTVSPIRCRDYDTSWINR